MKKIFISSVQKEFAKERKQLAKYIRNDIILRRFFDVFLFEEVPAQERGPSDVYLNEIVDSDIYLGILGSTYGNVNSQGISATEQEYNEAGRQNKERICFVLNRHKIRDIKQENFIHKVSTDTVRKKFSNYAELQNLVYEALVNYLSSRDYICTKPFDITKLTKPHKSIPVNPHLANAMYLAGYVERAGTGTEDIINKCREWGHNRFFS